MKKTVLIIVFLLSVSCGQVYNSNTFDQYTYGANGISDPVFAAGYNVLKSRCMTCHYHSGWSGYTTEEQWTSAGLVIAGSAATSQIMTRLKNNGGDMPTDAGPIPADEKLALETWINNI